MNNILTLIANEQIYHVFQPIYHTGNQRIIGYEALCRNILSLDPDALFKEAGHQNQLYALDTWSIMQAISAFISSDEDKKEASLLFINILPSTIVADAFRDFVQNLGMRYRSVAHRIVFEINESLSEFQAWNTPEFMRGIEELREKNFLIALDDVGEGSASFRKIIEISPDFIKLDKFFANKLDHSREKQKIVELLAAYCESTDVKLILEGIEQVKDLICARELGVNLGQGFYWGKPAPLHILNRVRLEEEDFHGR